LEKNIKNLFIFLVDNRGGGGGSSKLGFYLKNIFLILSFFCLDWQNGYFYLCILSALFLSYLF